VEFIGEYKNLILNENIKLPIATIDYLMLDLEKNFLSENSLNRFYSGKLNKDIDRYEKCKQVFKGNKDNNINENYLKKINVIDKEYINTIIYLEQNDNDFKNAFSWYSSLLKLRIIQDGEIKKKQRARNGFSICTDIVKYNMEFENYKNFKKKDSLFNILNNNNNIIAINKIFNCNEYKKSINELYFNSVNQLSDYLITNDKYHLIELELKKKNLIDKYNKLKEYYIQNKINMYDAMDIDNDAMDIDNYDAMDIDNYDAMDIDDKTKDKPYTKKLKDKPFTKKLKDKHFISPVELTKRRFEEYLQKNKYERENIIKKQREEIERKQREEIERKQREEIERKQREEIDPILYYFMQKKL